MDERTTRARGKGRASFAVGGERGCRGREGEEGGRRGGREGEAGS